MVEHMKKDVIVDGALIPVVVLKHQNITHEKPTFIKVILFTVKFNIPHVILKLFLEAAHMKNAQRHRQLLVNEVQ
jgi:hypothetical protein